MRAGVDEATLAPRGAGQAPQGEGWFVVNAADAAWVDGPFGVYTQFEGEARFPQFGINLSVLQPGQSNCRYHGEDNQEDFLVLDGECLLIVEEQERPLRRWDLVHCPAGTRHVFVGAGDTPCLLLSVGARFGRAVRYPVSPVAQRHRAGVETETDSPREAYADVAGDEPVPFSPGWLPGT